MTIIMMIALFENKGFILLEKFLKASSQNFPIKIKYPSVIHPLTHSRINTLTHSNEFRERSEQENLQNLPPFTHSCSLLSHIIVRSSL